MASSYHQYLNCSKSQMCLFKILRIISSIPPSKEEASPRDNKGIGIDLNLRFCSVAESESSAETASNAFTIEQGNDDDDDDEVAVEEEGVGEKSVDNTQVQSFEVDNNNDNGVDDVESESEDDGEGNGGGAETSSFGGRGREGGSDSNCLDLLIEAARVLSGKDKDESEWEEGRGVEGELRSRGASDGRVKKRKERWVVVDLYGDVVEEEERQPVVRSNRGRNQALPYRFRDSVVEPLKRLGRSHRPSSTANATKRPLR